MISTVTLVDSHCHLNQIDLAAFDGHLDEVLNQAREVGVRHFLCVCVALADVPVLQALVVRYADVSMSVGVHPNEEMVEEVSAMQLVKLGSDSRCIAIGETGLDYY